MNEESTDIVAVPNPLFEALARPFPISEIEFRAGATNQEKTKALALAYITSRAAMARLDAVMGPGNWKDEYTAGPAGGVLCSLSLRINNEWITKQDGAENTNFEAVKGGFSDAFKRACVKWGIGRYLYYLSGTWVKCQERGKSIILAEDPRLPEWALPGGSGMPPEAVTSPKPRPSQAAPSEAQVIEGTVEETSPKASTSQSSAEAAQLGRTTKPMETGTPKAEPTSLTGTRQKNQWPDAQKILKTLMQDGLIDSVEHAVGILNHSVFMNVAEGKLELYDIAVYLCGWQSLPENLSTNDKAELTNEKYLAGAPKEWEDAAKHILGMKL